MGSAESRLIAPQRVWKMTVIDSDKFGVRFEARGLNHFIISNEPILHLSSRRWHFPFISSGIVMIGSSLFSLSQLE
jgi:hypothetical protein